MIDHYSTYATDFDATKAFYDAAFKPLGYGPQLEMVADWDEEFPNRRLCAYGPEYRPIFWVVETKVAASPRHVAFTATDRDTVDAFHKAGLGVGGSNNGATGQREIYHPNYYGAFLLDPDGNNVEAVCHLPASQG